MGILKWSCCLTECVATGILVVDVGQDIRLFSCVLLSAWGAQLVKMLALCFMGACRRGNSWSGSSCRRTDHWTDLKPKYLAESTRWGQNFNLFAFHIGLSGFSLNHDQAARASRPIWPINDDHYNPTSQHFIRITRSDFNRQEQRRKLENEHPAWNELESHLNKCRFAARLQTCHYRNSSPI